MKVVLQKAAIDISCYKAHSSRLAATSEVTILDIYHEVVLKGG